MTSSPQRNANDLTRFVAAQAALRRVAMLVGRGAPQAEVFDAVATELGQLAGADGASIVRYESDGTATVVAGWGRSGAVIPVGANVSLEGRSVTALVSRTGRSARMDSYADAPGPLAALLREQGIRSTVGAPIVVEGRVWGVVTASMSRDEPLAPDAEVRLAYSTELIAAVIANAQARADLAASRAREAAVADQARRRIERNLHDGVQQQLVALILEVGNAQVNIPAEMPQLRQLLATVKQELTGVLDDLRDISRGLYPAILSDVGLQPALNGLIRRSPIPVELNAHLAGRLPEPAEVAAYYIVSESLANAAKHAHASRVHIDAAVRDGWLHLSVADDGAGGADPARGSGLVGLTDRVDAMGGSFTINSPAGQGTHLQVHLPL
ncbi:GAF domain-containing protein [Dactylosporangium sp. NPDC049525]|uniref:GAF domain-containing sensor histidine kinase n=1 Tax=Dactylosporangium sp. NPDC049525 TaxID=3154730 RepID=UPI00342A1811